MERFLSIVRYILIAAGSYFMGKSFLGQEIDDNLWLGISGAIVSVAAVLHGIFTKKLLLEQLESALRNIITVVGSALVGSGVITSTVLESALQILAVLIPVSLSESSRTKADKLQKGETSVLELKSN